MFDYGVFKAEMVERGHDVKKRGKYIDIVPNNNYKGYSEGFAFVEDVIEDFTGDLTLLKWDHCNQFIYSVTFKINSSK